MTDHIILEVQMIHRKRGIAILSDGQEVPITKWLKGDGECQQSEATACLCGPCFDGYWYSADLSEYEGAIVQ
jgi:hypothetical protein